MGERMTFPDAVKAAKFLMFATTMYMISSEKVDLVQAITVVDMANETYLTPEWRVEREVTSGKHLFYEGSKQVFNGTAKEFASSDISRRYDDLINRVWNATELIDEMRQKIVELATPSMPTLEEIKRGIPFPHPYKGDYNDTEVYEIWKRHMRKGSVLGRLFGR